MLKITTVLPFFLLALITACGDSRPPQAPTVTAANVSSDATIQAAYSGCVRDMTQELVNDNPGTEQAIMNMMLQPVPDMCHGVVVKPCEKDRKSFICQTMIDDYKNK